MADRVGTPELEETVALRAGTGEVFKWHGERVAVYRDDDGRVFACSAVCTHMGCVVHWNGAEKSWDCPCHGSRFNYDGKVIQGPANTDLEKKSLGAEAG